MKILTSTYKIHWLISLSCALDHRVVDAIHGGRLFKIIKDKIRNIRSLEDDLAQPSAE